MKGSSFEQLLVLKKKNVFIIIIIIIIIFCICGYDSRWGVSIWTNSQSRFSSRIDVKFGGQVVSEELFNNIMILYMYTAQGRGRWLPQNKTLILI